MPQKLLSAILFIIVMLGQSLKGQDSSSLSAHVKGAVRYNILGEYYQKASQVPQIYATFDTWWLNVVASSQNITLDFQYRFYPTFSTHFIHHGYFGFCLFEHAFIKLGVTQVPFGITPYASHSWWFQGPYYVGLEDDYDMGVKIDFPSDKWHFTTAFFLQSEPQGPAPSMGLPPGEQLAGRYSYDIVPGRYSSTDDTIQATLEERHTLNLKARYDVMPTVTTGLSFQYGGIYNAVLQKYSHTNAWAAHVNVRTAKWDFKAEYIQYRYNGMDNNGQPLDVVKMGAYGLSYNVASRADMYVAGAEYVLRNSARIPQSIRFYVDFSYIHKRKNSFYDTYLCIPGVFLKMGQIETYIDYAMGKNHPWLTNTFGEGLGQGKANAPWNARLNINVGYYF